MESESNQNIAHNPIPNPQTQEIPKKIRSTMENIIQNLLKSSQVKTEATSNIVAKLNEFSMKYMMETLEEAKLFAEYAKRNNITGEDVNLVITKNSDKYQKIPQYQLEEMAKNRNKLKLSVVLEPGIKLPNNDFLLNKVSKNLLIEDKRQRSMSEEEKDESKEDEFENNEKERKDSNGVDELNENEKNDGEELWNNDNNLETEIKSENSVDNEPKPKKKIKK